MPGFLQFITGWPAFGCKLINEKRFVQACGLA
jgi:hypothetical protein